MKNILLLLFVGFSSILFAQQKAFIDRSKYKGKLESTNIYIPPSQDINLGEISKEAKHLIVEIPLDPESTNEEKQKYIQYIIQQLEAISKLEGVYFEAISVQVGEQIFLTREEVTAIGDNAEKRAEVNLKNAWTALGPTFQQFYPKAKVYGFNWGW